VNEKSDRVDLLARLRDVVPEDRVATEGEEIERHGRVFYFPYATSS
jgi:hypothetical protein